MVKINKLEPHRHVLAFLSFSYLVGTTYAYSTGFKAFKIPGLKQPKDINVSLLEINDFTDWLWANFWIGLFYASKYIIIGYALELTHPAPKTEYRKKMTKKQQQLGVQALFWVIITTTLIMWFVEHRMPYYGYFATREVTISNILISIVVYMFAFDTWFWFTHVALHHPVLWKLVHKCHHEFVEPSAFAQDAVHPIEAIIQGPLGHYLGAIIFPIHPVALAIYGLLTSIYALLAHDGRIDPNFHVAHHHYVNCNYGIYWGFWDIIFKTRYCEKTYKKYVYTWERENKKAVSEDKTKQN